MIEHNDLYEESKKELLIEEESKEIRVSNLEMDASINESEVSSRSSPDSRAPHFGPPKPILTESYDTFSAAKIMKEERNKRINGKNKLMKSSR